MALRGSYGLAAGLAASAMAKRSAAESLSRPTPVSSPMQAQSIRRPAALVDWFKSIEGRHSVSGQFIGTGQFEPITDIRTRFGKWLGLIGLDYYSFNAERRIPADIRGNSVATAYWKAGGLITISVSMPNPSTGGGCSDTTGVSLADLLNPSSRNHAALMMMFDQIAAGLAQLRDAGVIVIWRPFHESCGRWFWWGPQSGTAAEFVRLWTFMHDYFTRTKKLDNLVWLYASGNQPDANILDRLPPPGYVDMIGQDAYSSNPLDYLSVYQDMAKTGLPMCIAEFGSGNTRAGDLTFPLTRLVNDIRSHMPKTVYWLNWQGNNRDSTGWGMAQNTEVAAALADPWVLNRGDITFFDSTFGHAKPRSVSPAARP
jgi:mannan endo-1,4-beta-mannosidase